MNPQDKIQNKLEIVFNKYKLTPEQKAQAAMDLIELGEAQTFEMLSSEIPEEKKVSFQSLFSVEMKEPAIKKVYAFLAETFPSEKITEVRSVVYDKLIFDYITHMNS